MIEQSIYNCDFYALDTEFTGNTVSYKDKLHDFDTFEAKYRKQKEAVEQFIALEVGLTFFKWEGTSYKARPFNFLIYPRSAL